MSFTDPIGDMIVRIKNAQMRSHKSVQLPSSNFKAKIAEVLKTEGYIIDYSIDSGEKNKNSLKINLKYTTKWEIFVSLDYLILVKQLLEKSSQKFSDIKERQDDIETKLLYDIKFSPYFFKCI